MIKVLIAEDHSIVREGLKMILELNENITVIGEAEDGLDAIKKANILKPDIIIMDIAMPNMNGIEACRRIKEENSLIKVVILSMYSSNEDIIRALKAGATGYILKESIGKELVETVIKVYKGQRYLSKKIEEILIDSFINVNNIEENRDPLDKLSSREKVVLQMVAEGKASSEIAELLFLSPKTVDTYRSRIMHKLGIKELSSLIKFAIQHGLIK